MRTAKEIRQYLKCQPWYNNFKYYTKTSRCYYWHDKSSSKKALRGYRYVDTISVAFSWRYTIEGFDVWDQRDMTFRKWYFKNENTEKNSRGL